MYAQKIGDKDVFFPGLLTGLGCVRLLELVDLRVGLDFELCFRESSSFALLFRDDLYIRICLETYAKTHATRYLGTRESERDR